MIRKLIVASALLAFVLPAAAQAKTPTHRQMRTYWVEYNKVRAKDGNQIAGCALIGHRGRCHGKTTAARMQKSIDVLGRDLAPRPVYVAPVVSTTYTSAPTAYSSSPYGGSCGGNTPYSGGGQCWAIPYSIVLCESGGQNIPNSQGSGANGYYQLMIGGTGSRSEQDARAHAMWNGGAGAGNWTCAGA